MEPETRTPAIRVTLLPRDTNGHGTIFGGVLLSLIDQAGAIEAAQYTDKKIVTVAMREVVFHEPVRVGDLVSLYTDTKKLGTSSITVRVEVRARRLLARGEAVAVTEAEVVYVAVDDSGRPIPFR